MNALGQRSAGTAAATAVATLIDGTRDGSPVTPTMIGQALGELGIGGPQTDRLAEEVDRARRDHGRLRRRERELAALYSSARELAAVQDGDAVLARLVARAHEMMASDVTYLSEFDPATRELRVRKTAGSVSPDFQRLRVPPGAGLASVVVETRTAQWSSRYADYRADRHDAGIDHAVEAEGIVSLLGVPMLSSDHVLGVLFVADRDEHQFAPEEVALLTALADHAAVVLQTARAMRNLRRSEDEARSALERLRGHLVERDRANTVHQELVQAVLAGGGYEPVAGTLSSALDRPVVIIDEAGAALAGVGSDGSTPALTAETDDAISTSRSTGHCVAVGARTVAAITAGSQYFGAILLGAGEFDLGPVDRRTVERAAQVGALLALQQRAVAETERRLQTELVADLLDAAPERRPEVVRRSHRLGIRVDDLETVSLFVVASEHAADLVRVLAELIGTTGLVGEHRGQVVALHRHDAIEQSESTWSRVRSRIGADLLLVTPTRIGSLPEQYLTATRTARLLDALGVSDGSVCTDDYLPYAAVLDTDRRTLNSFLGQTIGAVRGYDTERGTDLLGTLRAFIRNDGSPTRTARSLNFHPNTILQRLARLDRLLGDGWRQGERLFRIGMAVRLDELLEQVSGRGE